MSYLVEGKTGNWEVIIGLEVHAQIISNSKLFSASSTQFGSEPNSNVSFIDAGLPGVLPHLNMYCVEQAIKTGLVLNGEINELSYFDRKHYFYPDLPFGYQITQFYKPIMQNGYLNIELEDDVIKKIRIERLHIEQDAGKLLHEHHANKSFVDLNRAGVGLMEIVSYPDIRSKLEAAAYVNKLRKLLRYVETCDGNMEEGSLRCDINVSVRRVGENTLRTRTEIKNVNSIRFIQQAIDYEAKVHVETWENDKEVIQETKLFNPENGKTYSLRKKEDAGDYRYIRDPDILPLKVSKEQIDEIKHSLPELPDIKRERYMDMYGLNFYEASILSSDKDNAWYFESTVENSRPPKLVSNWIITNLFSFLNKENLTICDSKVSPNELGELIDLIENDVISGKVAKDIFEEMWLTNKNPKEIINEKGLTQITDVSVIEEIVEKILAEHKDKVIEIRSGKENLLGWLVGTVIKESKGKANPKTVNRLLREKVLGQK